MRFLSTFGRLPGTWRNLFVMVLSGMAEGIGLALFIPLLQLMNGNTLAGLPAPFPKVVAAIENVGLAITPMTLLVLIAAFVLGALALGYLQRRMLVNAKHAFTRDLRGGYFGNLLKAKWGYLSRLSHGEIINQLITESQRSGLALSFELMAVATAIQIALYVAFSAVISWQLMTLATGFGVLVFLIVRPLTRRAKSLGQRTNEANRDLSFFGLEYLRNFKLLKATASEDTARQTIGEKTTNLFSVGTSAEMNMVQVYFLIQALPVVMITAIIGISYEVLQTPVSSLLVFLLFMARIAPRVAQLQQQVQGYFLHSPAVRAVDDMIREAGAEMERRNPDGKRFERIGDAIVLDNVRFDYPDGQSPALDGLSLTIGRNQMVAIVGGSGAGKSTLMDMLIGLREPDTGRIAIDDTGLDDFDIVSWRRRIGIVPQGATVFNASLGDNLRFFSPDATDDDIASAIGTAHLDDVVEQLPEGLDTIVGENGVRLSGGQVQRLALARALVGKPELLLLDEATSALDNESERRIQDAISAIAHTMTIVVIAHRLSTVRRADAIHVMERGRIVETGTYDALMGRNGRFAELKALELS